MEHASAIYEPMIPMGWIGDEPADRQVGWAPGSVVPADWCDIVISRRLTCGLVISAQRRGFTVYDFAQWPPGVPSPAAGTARRRLRTVAERSEHAKPALIQRLRIVNTSLTLLHAAAMFRAQESPTVVRVNERDLFRFDYHEEGGGGYWFQPFGNGLPAEVTVNDRNRFGVLPTGTVDLALEWLDVVVASDALIEFDLLNQTQAAVSTHDYALAVVAGWTICELRTRALAAGLPGVGVKSKAGEVCDQLERLGQLPSGVVARLHGIRARRNTWLHSGVEPVEADALEALRLATELLRSTVPCLTTRATSSVLVL